MVEVEDNEGQLLVVMLVDRVVAMARMGLVVG